MSTLEPLSLCGARHERITEIWSKCACAVDNLKIAVYIGIVRGGYLLQAKGLAYESLWRAGSD